MVNALRYHDRRGDTETLAYAVMPDHLHWLVFLRRGTVSSLMRQVKGYVGRRLNELHDCRGSRFWQSGFHDHAVRSDEDLRKLARYVVANPLRAGIVDDLGQYPHWDASWL